jgi:hypothetical protein
VDTLDVGLSVAWDSFWPQVSDRLDREKQRAAGTAGLPSADRRYVMLPSGKPPAYRWHLQYPGFHLFLAKGERPHGETPNVFASLAAETLWRYGVKEAVRLVAAEVESIGGTVEAVKPSRCDLAADFHIPGGLTLEYVRARRCPSHTGSKHYMTGERLESFYQGSNGSPLICRIYDKGVEVLKEGTKLWFREVWKREIIEDIWRIEFQIRRPVLKELKIDTVEDLVANRAELWAYLTRRWFTLREPGPENATRREPSPLWQAVQESVGEAAEDGLVRCKPGDCPADASWYVSHVAGCMVGYAARKGIDDASAAAGALATDVTNYWRVQGQGFDVEYARKRIAMGRVAPPLGQPSSEAA